MHRAAVLAAFFLVVPSAAADPPNEKLNLEPVSARLIGTLVHPDPKSPIWLLRYSSDGHRLAAAGYPSGILQIWDPSAGKELARVTTPSGRRGTAEFGALTADWQTAFTPYAGRKVVQIDNVVEKRTLIEYDGSVRVWDVASGKPRSPIRLAPGRGASTVWVSPHGTKLITFETQSYEQTEHQFVPLAVVYRDLSRGDPPIELADEFGMAAFASDGKAFVLTTGVQAIGQSRIRLFSAITGKETIMLGDEPKANIFFPAFSPDGKRVAAEIRDLGEAASVVKVWDRDSGREMAVLKPTDRSVLLYPEFSADGRFVTAIPKGGTAYVWDATTGTAVLTHRFGENGLVRAVAVSPDGRLGAVVGTPREKNCPLSGRTLTGLTIRSRMSFCMTWPTASRSAHWSARRAFLPRRRSAPTASRSPLVGAVPFTYSTWPTYPCGAAEPQCTVPERLPRQFRRLRIPCPMTNNWQRQTHSK